MDMPYKDTFDSEEGDEVDDVCVLLVTAQMYHNLGSDLRSSIHNNNHPKLSALMKEVRQRERVALLAYNLKLHELLDTMQK